MSSIERRDVIQSSVAVVVLTSEPPRRLAPVALLLAYIVTDIAIAVVMVIVNAAGAVGHQPAIIANNVPDHNLLF